MENLTLADPQRAPRRLPVAGADFLVNARTFLRGLLDWVKEEQGEGEHPPAAASSVPGQDEDLDGGVQGAGVAFLANMQVRGSLVPHALFMKRASDDPDAPGVWAFPAGNIENGETPVDAAAREAQEEAGDAVPVNGLVPWDARQMAGVNFRTFAQPVEKPFRPILNDEHEGFQWAPLDAPPQPLHPGVAATLDAAKAGDIAMDPLTDKGQTIMRAMEKSYQDPEKAKRVFYASRNSGKISGVDGAIPTASSAVSAGGGGSPATAPPLEPNKPASPSRDEELQSATIDTPLLIRLMEFAREDAPDDQALHAATERLLERAKSGQPLTMADYEAIVGGANGSPSASPAAADAPAYHGTRATALQQIRDNGLLGHPNKRYHADRFYQGDRGASVYLAADPNVALQWALSEVATPADATVLEVDVPPERLVPDEAAEGAERFVGNIPPELITNVYSVNPDGTLGLPQPFNPPGAASTGTPRFVALTHQTAADPAPLGGTAPAVTPQTTASPPAATDDQVLEDRFQMMPGLQSIMDKQTGQVFNVDDVIRHVVSQDAVPTFERLRDSVKNRATDPAGLAAWLKRKLDPEWKPGGDATAGMDAGSWRRIQLAAFDAGESFNSMDGWMRVKLAARDARAGDNDPPVPAPAADMALAGDSDPRLAMDWGSCCELLEGSELPTRPVMAFDRESVREYSQDGHLHVKEANIAQARVDVYRGNEIPAYQQLGLDPNRKYRLWRSPAELSRPETVASGIGKPILIKHQPLTADRHPDNLVIGSIGSDVRWEQPFIRSSLSFWPKRAIDGIESGMQRQLSPAYHYVAQMKPGVTPEGEPYDGTMTRIFFNHWALVAEGRQGDSVVVGDSALDDSASWLLIERELLAISA